MPESTRRLPVLTDAELFASLRQTLTDLSMLSELPARTYGTIISGSKERSGPEKTTSSYYRFRNRLLRALVDAEKEYQATVKGPDRRPETREEFRARILTEPRYQAMTSQQVADAEGGITARYVRKIRQEAGWKPRRAVGSRDD
jgi:hypothetical protein